MGKARTISEIDLAIGAHTRWKMRLRTALACGEEQLDALAISRDDQCVFGQWLHGGNLDPTARASTEFAEVVRLHAEFHISAGRIVAAIDEERRDLAGDIMLGEFAQRSDRLIKALQAWKAALRAQKPVEAAQAWEGQSERRLTPAA